MEQVKMHYTIIDTANAALAEGGTQIGVLIGGTENNYLTHKFASNGGATVDQEIKLSLTKLEYEKGMYKAGHIILTFTTSDNLDLLRRGLSDLASKDVVISANINSNFVAQGYYIHSTRITQRKDTSKGIVTEVFMHCYSPDHKLTLKPASNAWTGKKFAEELVSGQLTGAGFTKISSDDNTTKNYAEKHYFRTSAANLSFLANTKNTAVTEARQPYLVQYNEPFFDFVCRTANRCGEFVYHDGGIFCIGLPEDTLKTIKTVPTDTTSESGTVPDIIDSVDIVNVDDAKDSTSVYTNNYHDDDVAEGENGQYDSTIADDSNMTRLSKDAETIKFWGTWQVVNFVNSYLQQMQFADSVNEAITTAASDDAQIAIVQKFAQDDFEDKYLTDKDKFNTSLGLEDIHHESGKNFIATLLNEYYEEMRKLEVKASSRVVNLNYQDKLPGMHLGEAVYFKSLGKTWHIVTAMSGSVTCSDNSMTEQHNVQIVPVMSSADISSGKTFGTNGSEVKYFAVPPFGDFPHIHKAEPQEAIVVDNADPLYMGRVRVRYLWQKARVGGVGGDGVSPWIRVSTPFAGTSENLGGMCMTPAIGSRVMLGYMHDNIELPYVDGGLYGNGTTPGRGYQSLKKGFISPGMPLRVIGSASGHAITFMDGTDEANFYGGMVPMVKTFMDMLKVSGKSEAVEKKKNNEKSNYEHAAKLTGGMVLKDVEGIYEINMSTNGRSISINSPIGKVDINAFTGITISAPNGDVNIVGKNINLKAGNNVTIQSGAHIQSGDFSGADFLGLVGSMAGKIAAASATAALQAGLEIDFSKLCDLKFIRAVTETIIRPVEGTLKIASNRNIVMTSGKGNVTVPKSLMSKAKKFQEDCSTVEWNQSQDFYKDKAIQQAIQTLVTVTANIDQKVASVRQAINTFNTSINNIPDVESDGLIDAIKNDYRAALKKNKLFDFIKLRNIKDNKLECVGVNLIFKAPDAQAGGAPQEGAQAVVAQPEVADPALEQKKATFVENLNAAIAAYEGVIRAFQGITAEAELKNKKTDIDFLSGLTRVDKIRLKNMNGGTPPHLPEIKFSPIFLYDDSSKQYECNFVEKNFKRICLGMIISACSETLVCSPFGNVNTSNDNDWQMFVDSIKKVPQSKTSSFFSNLASGLGSIVGIDADTQGNNSAGKLFNWNGQAGPRAVWETGGAGGILISNNAGKTYKLKETGDGWESIDNPGVTALKEFLKTSNDNTDKISNYITTGVFADPAERD